MNIEWSNKHSNFLKKRWQENRADMIAIARKGGQVKGKKRPPLSDDVKRRISETLKRNGCHPPWELSPAHMKGLTKEAVFGKEIAEKMRQAIIFYNKTKVVTIESRIKMSKAKQGERNPGWKGGVKTETEIIRNGLELKAWRRAVFVRDNWACQKCPNHSEPLNAHHIKGFINNPELRFDINNGITLCLDCHKATDSYGGKWERQ